MNRYIHTLIFLFFAAILGSCGGETTGDLKIKIQLPKGESLVPNTDRITVKIYSKKGPEDEYTFANSNVINVNSASDKQDFTRSLKSNRYYLFFVEVSRQEGERFDIVYTGGVEGMYYDEKKNFETNLFLSTPGSAKRLLSGNGDELKSHIPSSGSEGVGAVTLADGKVIFLGGKYKVDGENDQIFKNVYSIDMRKLERDKLSSLSTPIYDHDATILRDDSLKGKVVVTGGNLANGSNTSILLYDPEKGTTLKKGSPGSYPSATSIGNAVYVTGGCNSGGASGKIYKVDKKGNVSPVSASLSIPRCNHASFDFSTYDKDGKPIARILVVGGSKVASPEKKEDFISNGVAELVNLTTGSSTTLEIDALSSALVTNPSASTLHWDNKKGPQTGALLVGGTTISNKEKLVDNSEMFLVYEENGKWYAKGSTGPSACPRGSASWISQDLKDRTTQRAVFACGKNSAEAMSIENEGMSLIEVKTSPKNDSFSIDMSSKPLTTPEKDDRVKTTNANVVTNSFGQAFVVGGTYIYVVSGFSEE